jgi:hypothetical protein
VGQRRTDSRSVRNAGVQHAVDSTSDFLMPDLKEFVIRAADAGDAGIIARHRASMFQDMGAISAKEYELLLEASERWTADMLANHQYVGWLVEDGPAVIAGGGLLLRELFPVPGCY